MKKLKLYKFWDWLRSLPIVRPLLGLAYSRKAMIAAFLTGLIVKYVPALMPVQDEVEVAAAQVVGVALLWVGNMLLIALEDAAEKRSGSFRPR